MKTVEIVREVACESPPEELWPALADTSRLNRIAGMAPVDFEPIESESGARFLVSTRLDGFPVTYEEEPFEWRTPDRFNVRRNMQEGVLHRLEMGLEIEPGANGGSIVRWRLRFELKFGFLAPFARLIGNWRVGTIITATRGFDAELRRPSLASAPPSLGDDLARASAALASAVTEDERPIGLRLAAWVATAADADVVHMRPYELADRWGEPRERVLAVFLEAVVAGMLQMYWDIVCPSCRTGASRVAHLFELTGAGHCSYCDIQFDLPLDRAVEAVFLPASAIRTAEARTFCTGGPAATPHVLSQAHLPGDGSATLDAPENNGVYRVFVRGGATARVIVETGGAASAELVAGSTLEPAEVHVAPRASIHIRQPGGSSRHVKLEHTEWMESAATAHQLSLQPRFRRLFSGEVLGAGRQLQVARVALLFSDLSASTALYTRVGDAPAFRLVQDHFELLREKIADEGGVVVKTIGDAVMAAFPDEGAAFRSAVEMQAAWDEFVAHHPDGCDTKLKIGVHAGPAYVVTANGALDYFGQTVNVTARLQGAAQEREIVVTDALADRATAAGWLGPARVSDRFDAVLKGLDTPIRSARIVI